MPGTSRREQCTRCWPALIAALVFGGCPEHKETRGAAPRSGSGPLTSGAEKPRPSAAPAAGGAEPAGRPPGRAAASVAEQRPRFALSDLLFGVDRGGDELELLRGDGRALPRGTRLWLTCGGAVFQAVAVGVEQTEQDDSAILDPCSSPNQCTQVTLCKPEQPVECPGRYVLGVLASFRALRPLKLRREVRSYRLKCEGCGLDQGKPTMKDSPPSEAHGLVLKAAWRLTRNPYRISSLFVADQDPIHWVAGTVGRGQKLKVQWTALQQTAAGTRTLFQGTSALPLEERGLRRSRHMMQHGCGVPFYAVPEPFLFFAAGKGAGPLLATAEQLPSDRVRFAVWRLTADTLRLEHRFPVELDEPKF